MTQTIEHRAFRWTTLRDLWSIWKQDYDTGLPIEYQELDPDRYYQGVISHIEVERRWFRWRIRATVEEP